MTKKFEKLIGSLKKIRLQDKEREKMHTVLMEYTKHFPTSLQHDETEKSSQISAFIFSKFARRAIPIAIILVAIIFGRGTNEVSFITEEVSQPNRGSTEVSSDSQMVSTKKNVEVSSPAGSLSDSSVSSGAVFDGSARDSDVDFEDSILYPEPSSDISDTREYLKIDYSARIQTRNVPNVVEKVEWIVRGVSGRIDQTSSGEKYGRVSFVIPKINLYEFRNEIEQITHSKLYTENISSQNLLNQKQDIERRNNEITESLDVLEQKKINLYIAHSQKISSIQAQIVSAKNQLETIRAEIELVDEDDEDELLELRRQETLFLKRITELEQDKTNENKSYTTENNKLLAQINQANGNLDAVVEEDAQLINTVDTVRGYIDVQWISLWNLSEVFSPTPMWLNIVLLALLLWWYLERRANSV